MLVNHGKAECVLVGPEVTFTATPHKITGKPGTAGDLAHALHTNDAARVDELLREKPGDEIVDYIVPRERDDARKRLQQIKMMPAQYPCKTCLNVGRCDGTSVRALDGIGPTSTYQCEDYMTKANAAKVREKATIPVPKELVELAKTNAGSRAEVLDLNELRAGSYRALKEGYINLSSEANLMDQTECEQTCTAGFHYAFDSHVESWMKAEDKNKTYSVCTNPKCVAQKKGAFTRAKNAAMAKKRAELAAIKEAVEHTVKIDAPRIRLIVAAFLEAISQSCNVRETSTNWLVAKLKLGGKTAPGLDRDKTKKVILDKVGKLTEEEAAKLLVELSLVSMLPAGNLEHYKIQTTEPLSWLGIGIQVKKPEKGEEVLPVFPVVEDQGSAAGEEDKDE